MSPGHVTQSKIRVAKNQNEIYSILHLTTLRNSKYTGVNVFQYPIVQLDIF